MRIWAILIGISAFAATDPDLALRLSLDQSRGALGAALIGRTPFRSQVASAYSGYEDAEEATELYFTRGAELRQTMTVVAAQLDAAKGELPGTAAAIRRRVGGARAMAQLYLVLPRDIASFDSKEGGNPEMRALFISAMNKIAFDGDYAAAEALRIRAVEELNNPALRL